MREPRELLTRRVASTAGRTEALALEALSRGAASPPPSRRAGSPPPRRPARTRRRASRERLRRLPALEVELEVALEITATPRRGPEAAGADLARVGEEDLEGGLRQPLLGLRLVRIAVEETLKVDPARPRGGWH